MLQFICLAVSGLLVSASCFALEARPRHPLDALTSDEYRVVRETLVAGGHALGSTRFAIVHLDEPAKSAVLAWQPGASFSRHARAVLLDKRGVWEAIVDLRARTLLSIQRVEGVQPGILFSDSQVAEELTRADPRWRAAVAARGIDDPDSRNIACLSLSAGYFAQAELEGRRLLRVECLLLTGTSSNVYQRPIGNLTTLVDVGAREVVAVVDDGPIAIPAPGSDYDAAAVAPLKKPLNPVHVVQPAGPSFELDGSMVRWGPWQFHLRFDRRRGTVVSLLDFIDAGSSRRVLYQASLSEMFVPYMDPTRGWYYKSFFDVGEFGFGLMATPLVRGVDCPWHATLLDGVIAFDQADPVNYEGAVCLFERPTMGPAWRHRENMNATFGGRPGVELVTRMVAAVGNYDYVFDWVLSPSGAIRVDIASTGIDIVKAVTTRHMSDDTAQRDTRYGTLLSPGLVAVNHDHFFSLRFDFDVDGTDNNFVKDRLVSQRLPTDNPRRSIWTVQRETALRESDAQLNIDLRRPVQWRVQSTTRRNAHGNPTGYVIAPMGNAASLLASDDFPQLRAAFTRHHQRVTRHAPRELYAAGEYPNQSRGGDGLPAWTASDRAIENTDLVVWYTVGFHHVTAAEDWPVLPVHAVSVRLKPHNFLDRNPLINAAQPAGPMPRR